MHSRDMTDKQRMEMMAEHVRDLRSLSLAGRKAFFQLARRSPFADYGIAKALELIGEAAHYMTQTGRNQYSKIDFDKWEGLRHDLTHDYSGVELLFVWQTIEKEVPKLYNHLHNYGFISG